MITGPSLRARLGAALAGAAVVATVLAGCTAATPRIDADTAAALQSGVMAVSVAAAAGDFTTAQADLAAVRDTLAASADTLTTARTSEIQAAIDLVDADLTAAIAASAPAEPVPAEPVTTADPENTDDADVPEDDGPGSDKPEKTDKGNDKGNDKGKDNPGQCKKKDTCE